LADGVLSQAEEGGHFGGAEAFDEDEPEETLAREVEATEFCPDGKG